MQDLTWQLQVQAVIVKEQAQDEAFPGIKEKDKTKIWTGYLQITQVSAVLKEMTSLSK